MIKYRKRKVLSSIILGFIIFSTISLSSPISLSVKSVIKNPLDGTLDVSDGDDGELKWTAEDDNNSK